MTSAAQTPRAIVVGTGFGCRIHIPALRNAGFEVAALVGRDPERTARRAERNGVPATYTDLSEAIERTGAVVVTVATPPNAHAQVALAAVQHGCHVVVEKPFASNSDEARAMLEAAQRAGVMHLVGHEFRWTPERNVAMRAIADGLIGEPRIANFTLYSGLVADPAMKMPRWWFDEGAGGGWLGAQGSHLIDHIRTWLGEFESLSAALPMASNRERGAAEDTYALRFRMVNGVEGVVQQSAGVWGPSHNTTVVAGTQGTVWIDGDTVWLADADGQRALPTPDELLLPPAPAVSDDPREMFSHLELGPYTRLCEALRATVDGRQPSDVVPLPTFADGLAEMLVMDAIRLSARNGGELVTVDS